MHGRFRVLVRHSKLDGLIGDFRDGLGLRNQDVDGGALLGKHGLDVVEPLEKLAFAGDVGLPGDVDFRSIRVIGHDLIRAISKADEIAVCPRKLDQRSIVAADEFGIECIGFLIACGHEGGGAKTDDAERQNERQDFGTDAGIFKKRHGKLLKWTPLLSRAGGVRQK